MIPESPARKNQTLSLLFASFNGTGLISQSPKYARMNLTKRISKAEKFFKRYFVETKVMPQMKIVITAKKTPRDFGHSELFFMLPSGYFHSCSENKKSSMQNMKLFSGR